MSRNQGEAIALGYGGDDQASFHQSEGLAYAHAWSTPKGDIGVAWAIGRTLRGEALWVKLIRVLPESRVTVGDIATPEYVGICGDMVATYLISIYCPAHQDPGWRIEPHRFVDEHTGVWQGR